MHKRERLWRIAFIAGTIFYSLITFYMFFVTAYDLQFFLDLLVAAILLGSVVIAIKWVLVSGVILVAESLFLIVWGIFLRDKSSVAGSLVVFLPALVVGGLFLITWFKHRVKTQISSQNE